MTDSKSSLFLTKEVPVTSRQTGKTKLVKGPVGKITKAKLVDEKAVAAPNEVAGQSPVSIDDASAEMNENVEANGKHDEYENKEKKKKLESCDEYVGAYFAGKIKSLSEDTIRSIRSKSFITTQRRSQFIDDAVKADLILDKTRQMLVLSFSATGYTGLAKSLRDFAKDVVLRHPIMGMQNHESWFPTASHSEDSNLKTLWNEFVCVTPDLKGESRNGDEGKEIKNGPGDMQKAKRNAFLCALLWRHAEQQINFNEFIRCLRSTVFLSSSRSEDIQGNLISFLVSSPDKDRSGIADIGRWFHDQAIYSQNLADQYRERFEAMERQKQKADELLIDKNNEIVSLNQQVEKLRANVEEAVEDLRVLKVHSKDDLERQTSKILRALEDDIPVLTDCLTALSRDPPKVEVAKEYLGTALCTLNNALKILREK